MSYGGASTSTQHLHQSLRWLFGVVAVVTDVGHVLLLDLCLDDFSCTQTELEASGEIGLTTTSCGFIKDALWESGGFQEIYTVMEMPVTLYQIPDVDFDQF